MINATAQRPSAQRLFMRAPPVTKVGPTTVQYKFVTNYYIRIQGSVVSWQDAATAPTATGGEMGDTGRVTETAAEGHRTAPASAGPQHTGRPRIGRAAQAHRRPRAAISRADADAAHLF